DPEEGTEHLHLAIGGRLELADLTTEHDLGKVHAYFTLPRPAGATPFGQVVIDRNRRAGGAIHEGALLRFCWCYDKSRQHAGDQDRTAHSPLRWERMEAIRDLTADRLLFNYFVNYGDSRLPYRCRLQRRWRWRPACDPGAAE